MADNQDISKLDTLMAPLAGSSVELCWRTPDAPPFRLSGFPWFEQDRLYRRLPQKPCMGIPEAVDSLANCTAGGQVAFQTDSPQVAIRVELTGLANMNHMPATGQCGFDLYVGLPGVQRFYNVTKFDHKVSSYEVLLFDHPQAMLRCFTLNFPLYMGVKAVHIGLLPEASLVEPPAWAGDGRIVIYGTSITQGGCASRPGMAFTNILSRALNREVINLGFSGNGRGEPEVIELMADIPAPALLVLDYHANAGGNLAQTLPVAVDILRKHHPTTPILIASRIAYAKDVTHADMLKTRQDACAIYQTVVADRHRIGDKAVYFVDGSNFLGSDFDECTVDGVHPTDLGFMRIAQSFLPEIRRALSRSKTV
jgi:lysophospholipase L1-like esterase